MTTRWPALPPGQWHDTRETLHLRFYVVGTLEAMAENRENIAVGFRPGHEHSPRAVPYAYLSPTVGGVDAGHAGWDRKHPELRPPAAARSLAPSAVTR